MLNFSIYFGCSRRYQTNWTTKNGGHLSRTDERSYQEMCSVYVHQRGGGDVS